MSQCLFCRLDVLELLCGGGPCMYPSPLCAACVRRIQRASPDEMAGVRHLVGVVQPLGVAIIDMRLVVERLTRHESTWKASPTDAPDVQGHG